MMGGFERFHKQEGGFMAKDKFMRLAASAKYPRISISRLAFEEMGSPSHVILFVDSERRALGFEPNNGDSQDDAYSISQGRQFMVTALVKENPWLRKYFDGRRLTPRWEGDLYVLPLKDGEDIR